MSGRRDAVWILVPQAASRLSSIYVFAAVAHRADPEQLGALTLATAMTGAAVALAPAIVGKPLAALKDPLVRQERAAAAHSGAVAASLGLALTLATLGLVSQGLVRLALLSGAIGVPAVMIVEGYYWRSVFVQGPRFAGLCLSAAYATQAAIVTFAVISLPTALVVACPLAALVLPAAAIFTLTKNLTVQGAWLWLTELRALWFPYVIGVAASAAMFQMVPVVLSATAGFPSAGAYRAGELAFGGTNLLIAVGTQALLTRVVRNARRVYARISAALVATALFNALAIDLAPRNLLQALIGPTTPLLREVLAAMAVQRAALAVSSIGATLLVSTLPPRAFGILEVITAVTSMFALVFGAAIAGLNGAVSGLAGAEILFAVMYASLLRRST